MSNRFRDLEKPSSENRKDVVLMAAVSAFESLSRPGRQDFTRFSTLFPKLFDAASMEARRTAAAALSRLEQVPREIAEMIVHQPIEVAAPFISHYANLSEALLARAIARYGVGHARAAARRVNLSPRGLAALWALDEPSVNRALGLRGLTVESAFGADIAMPDLSRFSEMPAAGEPAGQASRERREIDPVPPLARLDELHSTDPATEGLRDRLRELAATEPGPQDGTLRPLDAANSGPRVGRVAGLLKSHRDFSTDAERAAVPLSAHLERLARFAPTGDANWFATALADAMGSSFSLAERIMLDLSGTQLATAMRALGSDTAVILMALETYFPHLRNIDESGSSRATFVVGGLVRAECAARLAAWRRADAYTRHLPVDETLPDGDEETLIPEPSNDISALPVRKTA